MTPKMEPIRSSESPVSNLQQRLRDVDEHGIIGGRDTEDDDSGRGEPDIDINLGPARHGHGSNAAVLSHQIRNHSAAITLVLPVGKDALDRRMAIGSLLVTNASGIIGGRDAETDDDFRYRIYLKLTSQSGINETALRYQLLQLPGIQDVVFVTSAGSFMVYLYAISPVVPPSLLQLANSTLATTVAFPIQASALSPDLVGISLSTTISFVSGTAPADQVVVLSAATARRAANYINNLAIFDAKFTDAKFIVVLRN